jgi:hypothetical protein
MNFGGHISLIKRDTSESERIWYIKQWYILYFKPKNSNDYNISLSMANLYINTFYDEMKYSVPNINGILEHIDLNLV